MGDEDDSPLVRNQVTDIMTTTQSTTPSIFSTAESDAPSCEGIITEYEIAPAVICGMLFVFGIVYTFLGYRCFKATMFLTGFIFGTTLTYMICLEEDLLPLSGKIGVALAAGILCGLIAMLVQYVGLFTTGLCLGLLLAVVALIIIEIFYHPTTKWIPIGLLFGLGIVFALLTLYFQRSLTIFATAMFGAAQMTFGLDYYLDKFAMVNYVRERTKALESSDLCWYSWALLGLWPFLFVTGSIVQFTVTGKNFDHQEVVRVYHHKKKVAQTSKQKQVNLERIRAKERRDNQHNRYRHLYQVRRCNGDVISQSFIENIQHKLSPATRNITGVSSGATDTDSPQTTLSQIP